MNRKLDYIPRLHPANRAYRITTADPELLQKSRYWVPGYPVLDQGQEGACVGYGCTGEAMASPVRVQWAEPAQQVASEVYRRCLQIDEFEGERDEGTSVRAGMLVGRERGWWSGFTWAFSMIELRAALETGPVIIGVLWTDGMYEAPGGILTPTGDIVGGHCLLVTGYSANYARRGPRYRLRNSWGPAFGLHGNCYISPDDLNQILFQAGGEAACPIGRAL